MLKDDNTKMSSLAGTICIVLHIYLIINPIKTFLIVPTQHSF